jgi:hypothetical protein
MVSRLYNNINDNCIRKESYMQVVNKLMMFNMAVSDMPIVKEFCTGRCEKNAGKEG